MNQIVPIQPVSGEVSRVLDPEDLAAYVDVFRTLLEWERKYGGDMKEEELTNGSDHHQPS